MSERLTQLGRSRFDGAAFGLRVRLAMARANLSLRQAAALVEIDQANLHRVAKHGKPPCVETYLRLCEWLDRQKDLEQSDAAQGEAIGANGQAVRLLEIGGRVVEVDAEIAPIVAALNAAGVPTKASCSGHGCRPGSIVLADGREIIIARNFEEGRLIGKLFPLNINGDSSHTNPVQDDEPQ